MIQYIHTQLSIWGRWSIRKASDGLGYSNVSPMFKGQRYGEGFGSTPPVGIDIGSIDEMLDIDEAVKRLNQEQRQLVVEFYALQKPAAEIGQRLGIKRNSVYDRLHAIQQKILHNLQEIELSA